MISAEAFCGQLDRVGIDLVTTVPCSTFAEVVRLLDRQPGRHLPAADEGAAFAIAAGAELTGRRAAALVPQSGFGNLVNPLISVGLGLGSPVLLFMQVNGAGSDADDSGSTPEFLTGTGSGLAVERAVLGLLDAYEVPHWVLNPDAEHLAKTLDAAQTARTARRPAFILVPTGTIEMTEVDPGRAAGFGAPDAIEALRPHLDGAAVFGTEVSGADNAPPPGHALALGIGAALAQPDRPVVVIDGDASAYRHLADFVTAGLAAPRKLLHVVLDDGRTASVEWVRLGHATGYRTTHVCASRQALVGALDQARHSPGPHLVVARLAG